jgi:adenine-specific DNA-methyltransferase
MYPRLYLGRNLLREDGVMFVSIDDNEVANLRLLMDEIFGAENFVAQMAVIRAEGGGLAKQMVTGHEYVLVYARSIDDFIPLMRPKDIRGKIVKKDGVKYWIQDDWLRKEFGKYGTLEYEEIEKVKGADKKREIDDGLSKGIYQLIEKNGKHIVGKLRRIDSDGSKFYSVIKHLSADGKKDIEKLGLANEFSYPKPISLIKDLVQGATLFDRDAIVLDFFAGSGTTAQAVMELNTEDGGNRKWILVQLPEVTDEKSEARKAGYATIADITAERIRRAGVKIGKGDTGFRLYQVAKSNFKRWNEHIADEKQLRQQILNFLNSLVKGATNDDLLIELLLKSGISPFEKIENHGEWYFIPAANRAICLSRQITVELFNEIFTTLKATNDYAKIIFLEVGFGNSSKLKVNLSLQLKGNNMGMEVV